ncbi:hypothetical protein J4760_00120 [Salinicoccus sp. ID82-1]|uniref:hypothetical protein n=1 Tax=Salinicoccus sp. ID82-1 TaxID=2820269 RepID=UPI001F3B660C|nr:hypothetical protein [Salinicoccus sp. ID82-1]MCG1008447.1 hypothetical protein [Salinicoccus sp. ID82-1]
MIQTVDTGSSLPGDTGYRQQTIMPLRYIRLATGVLPTGWQMDDRKQISIKAY